MKRVGVTGGIGSGKTTVCKVFEVFGTPVYYADDRAKSLMEQDAQLASAIAEAFGEDIYKDGTLQREELSKRVFNNERELAKLNALVHPAVAKDFQRWCEGQSAPYVIKEAALIYEAGSDKLLDKVIVVTTDEPLRIQRIMQRDNVDREAVLARMRNQLPQAEKVKRADFVIDNNGSALVLPQALSIHQALLTD